MALEHPDLAPGTKLYSMRITDSGEDATFARWEVVGPLEGVTWTTRLRNLDDNSIKSVQTNGRTIYDISGRHYSTDSSYVVDHLLDLAVEEEATLKTKHATALRLLTNLKIIKRLGLKPKVRPSLPGRTDLLH